MGAEPAQLWDESMLEGVGALKPGVYRGRDGKEYQVMRDGSTYLRTFRVKWKNGQQVRVGPTLRRVGTTRMKLQEKRDAVDHS